MPELLTELRERAAKDPKRIVYPEAADPRVLRAAVRIVEMRMARPILVGPPQVVENRAHELGIQLSHLEIVDPKSQPLIERYVQLLLPEWKSRGVTEWEAQKRFENPMVFATAMVRAGDADGFVGGASTTTAETVRAAIQCIGLHANSSTVSSFFLMVLPSMNLVFADCAVVPVPTVTQLADIALDAAHNTRTSLQVEPRVAFLSFSTRGSASHPSIDRIREAVATVKARHPS